MTLKSCVLYITLFSTVVSSLKCFVCDDPKDKLCKIPREETCVKNQTFCYVMSYTTFKLKEKWVLKGCSDKCSRKSQVSNETNVILETSFEKECCEGSLCNGLKQEKINQQSVKNKSGFITNNDLVFVVVFYVLYLVICT